MNAYSVKELAELFSVNEETIRRWIRSRRLKAEQSSKKQGNIVYEDDLFKFISDNPKYKKMFKAKNKKIDNQFSLKDLLKDLIIQRKLLDDYIIKIQSLLDES